MRSFGNRNSGSIYIILESIAYTVVLYLYNPFIQMFAKRMGANDIHIALLNSCPMLVAAFVLIPCSILIERISHKKQTIMVLLFANGLFYAAIAFVPVIPHQIRVMVYVALIGLMNWPGSLYLSTVQSYLADNFKGSDVNRVISQRSKYGILFGLITALATGLLLTEIPKTDNERLFLYQIFYAACFAITLLQLYFFSKISVRQELQDEDKQVKTGDGSVFPETKVDHMSDKVPDTFSSRGLKTLISNRPYIIFCLCGFAFHLAWQTGWPLLNIYLIDYAGLNEFQLGLLSVVTGITMFLSFSWWNRLIDKKGCKLAIILGSAGLAVNAFFFTTRQSFAVIIIISVILGVSQAGFNLSLSCGLLEILPSGRNTVYISAFNTLTNITGFIAPLIGVWIYKKTNIYVSLAIVGSFRALAVLFYALRWWFDRNVKMSI